MVGNVSIAFIKRAVAAGTPFFAYIAPKAAHEPFNPAPWYAGTDPPSLLPLQSPIHLDAPY